MDKVKHFFLLLFTTFFFGTRFGVGLAIGIEGAQAEAGNADVQTFLKRFFSKDSLLDLLADTLGILAGFLIRMVFYEKVVSFLEHTINSWIG